MTQGFIDRLYGITPNSVEKYLLYSGWVRDLEYSNKQLMVFHKSGDEARIAVPSSATNKDYYDRIYDLIQTLCVFSDYTEDEIIISLKNVFVDRLQFRIVAEKSKEGRIPLEYASKCVEGLKDLVLYAACAEKNPCPVCLRSLSVAKDSLESFEFEQTARGSFIFNIAAKVAEENFEQLTIPGIEIPIDEPIEHKIVKRIVKAIAQVSDVVQKKIKISELVETAFQDGITANMCDALSMLRPESGEFKLETTVYYADALTKKLNEPIVNTFDFIHFACIKEISDKYKENSQIEEITVNGTIRKLQKNNPAEEEFENSVYLVTKINNHNRTIRLTLSPKDHATACDAYRDDQVVEVSGILDKSSKNWFFSEVDSFRVVDREIVDDN